jgi:hypothetical protein
MSLMGSNIPPPVAGLTQAERVEARTKRAVAPKAAERRSRNEDTDLVIVNSESADADRGMASNDQEDAHEDRQEQPGYTPSGDRKPEAPAANLDING